jgi:hypothetical protein
VPPLFLQFGYSFRPVSDAIRNWPEKKQISIKPVHHSSSILTSKSAAFRNLQQLAFINPMDIRRTKMFAITPIVLVILALAGGGATAIGNSHKQDNNVVEVCEIVQTAVADPEQNSDLQNRAECDSAYEPQSHAALD